MIGGKGCGDPQAWQNVQLPRRDLWRIRASSHVAFLPIQLLQTYCAPAFAHDTHEGLTAARPQHSAAAIAFLISRNQCAFVSQAGPWHRLPERAGALNSSTLADWLIDVALYNILTQRHA